LQVLADARQSNLLFRVAAVTDLREEVNGKPASR
jgi:hypothetical protein